MSKISILSLAKTLDELGYDPDHSENFLLVISSILEQGYAQIAGRSIHAAGVKPLFKVNLKSIDVYLDTVGEMDTLRIHHPNNTWWNKNQGPNKATCLANKKRLARPLWNEELTESQQYSQKLYEKRTFSF